MTNALTDVTIDGFIFDGCGQGVRWNENDYASGTCVIRNITANAVTGNTINLKSLRGTTTVEDIIVNGGGTTESAYHAVTAGLMGTLRLRRIYVYDFGNGLTDPEVPASNQDGINVSWNGGTASDENLNQDVLVEDCHVNGPNNGPGSGFDVGRSVLAKIRRCTSFNCGGKSFSSAMNRSGNNITFESCVAGGSRFLFYPYDDGLATGTHYVQIYNCTCLQPEDRYNLLTDPLRDIGIGIASYDTWITATVKNCIMNGDYSLKPSAIEYLGLSIVGQVAGHLSLTSTNNAFRANRATMYRVQTTDYATLAAIQGDGYEANSVVTGDAGINETTYAPANSLVKDAGTWVPGVRAYDDLPLPLRPDIGAVQDRNAPGRKFGVAGGRAR